MTPLKRLPVESFFSRGTLVLAVLKSHQKEAAQLGCCPPPPPLLAKRSVGKASIDFESKVSRARALGQPWKCPIVTVGYSIHYFSFWNWGFLSMGLQNEVVSLCT